MTHASAYEARVRVAVPSASEGAIGAVARAVDAAVRAGACCQNGRLVEKLRHHRHLSGRNAAFVPEAR